MRAASLILRKDLLVLRRSPLLVGLLVAYPLVIALLIGLTAAYANANGRSVRHRDAAGRTGVDSNARA